MLNKISVIIPVYNNEKEIRQCIESVQRQTVKEIEILCINDGSIDCSAEIIYKIMEKDSRILLFEQANSGAGAARNLGLSKANGKYISFLDADDYFYDNDALEKMYDLCERNRISVCGSWGKALKNGGIQDINFYDDKKPVPEMISEYRDFQIDFGFYFWIYKRDMIVSNNILFPDYRRYQDPPFFVRAMDKAGRFSVIDGSLYCIRVSETSARYNPTKTIDLLRGFEDVINFSIEKEYQKLLKKTQIRLEWEYSDIIIKNISKDDIEKNRMILDLLLKIEKIFRAYFNDDTYKLRVIDEMLKKVEVYSKNYSMLIRNRIESFKSIAIYGTGHYGNIFYEFLKKNNVENKVCCFVESNKGNKSFVHDKKVVELKSFLEMFDFSEVLICVATAKISQKKIEELLYENGVNNYELIDNALLN